MSQLYEPKYREGSICGVLGYVKDVFPLYYHTAKETLFLGEKKHLIQYPILVFTAAVNATKDLSLAPFQKARNVYNYLRR